MLNPSHEKLTDFIYKVSKSLITAGNEIQLLVNGEEKFEALLKALRSAKHHIHIEYYIFETDNTGYEIAEILIEKARG